VLLSEMVKIVIGFEIAFVHLFVDKTFFYSAIIYMGIFHKHVGDGILLLY
jgi:hypothetical protein